MENNTELVVDYRRTGEVVVQALTMALIILSAVIGNILILLSVYRDRTLRTITNIFVVNLAIADLGLALIGMPFTLVSSITYAWIFGDTWCSINGTAVTLFCVASMLTLAAVSIDRYIAILYPFQYTERMNSRTATMMIVYIWLHSFLITLLPVFGWSRYIYIQSESICTFDWKYDIACTLFVFVVCFFIPLSVMVLAYYRVLQTARRHARRIVPITGRFSSKRLNNERCVQESSASTCEKDNTYPSQASSLNSEGLVSRETKKSYVYPYGVYPTGDQNSNNKYSITEEETYQGMDEVHRHSEDSGIGDSNQFTNSTMMANLAQLQRNSDDFQSQNGTGLETAPETSKTDERFIERSVEYGNGKGPLHVLDASSGDLTNSGVNWRNNNNTHSLNADELDRRDNSNFTSFVETVNYIGQNDVYTFESDQGDFSLTPIVVPVARNKTLENDGSKANADTDQTNPMEPKQIPLFNMLSGSENAAGGTDSEICSYSVIKNELSCVPSDQPITDPTTANPLSISSSDFTKFDKISVLSAENNNETRPKEFLTKPAWETTDEVSPGTSIARGEGNSSERKPRISVVISAVTPPPPQKRDRKNGVACNPGDIDEQQMRTTKRRESTMSALSVEKPIRTSARKNSVPLLAAGESRTSVMRKLSAQLNVSSGSLRAFKDRYTHKKQSIRQAQRFKKDNKAVRTLLIVVGTFILCWVPHFVGIFCLMTAKCSWPDRYFAITTWLAMLNSACNPVIYGAMSRQFRKRFKQILQCKRGFF